jgi:hypothetical protein
MTHGKNPQQRLERKRADGARKFVALEDFVAEEMTGEAEIGTIE